MGDFKIRPAIVAHLITPVCIEVFPQELQLHHPAAQKGLLTVLKDGVESEEIFLFTYTAATALGQEEVLCLPVSI